MVLCSIYLVFGVYGLLQEQNFNQEAVLTLIYIFVTFPLFILLDIFCIRINRLNRFQLIANRSVKIMGKLLSVISILLSLLTLYFCFKAYDDLGRIGFRKHSSQWNSLIFFIGVTVLIVLSTLINVLFFAVSLKKNKSMYLQTIDTIGEDTL